MKRSKKKCGRTVFLLAGLLLIALGIAAAILSDGEGALFWLGIPAMLSGGWAAASAFFGERMHGKDGEARSPTLGGMSAFRYLGKEVPEENAPAVVRWNGLKERGASSARVFFDKSGFHRFVIFPKDDYFSYRKERLYVRTADEWEESLGVGLCCEWISEDGAVAIYDTEEHVLRDLEGELNGYTEETLPPELAYAETPEKQSGGVCVWGDRPGGGSGDGVYFLCYAARDEEADALILRFSGGERCTVFTPEGIEDSRGEFSVRSASAVEWEGQAAGEKRRYERTDSGDILLWITDGDGTRERRLQPKGEAFRF